MNSIKPFFLLLFIAATFLVGPVAFADPKPKVSTPHSYDRTPFCSKGVEQMMAPLNEKNEKGINEIHEIKKSLNDFKAKSVLTTQISRIKDSYLRAVNNIAKSSEKKAGVSNAQFDNVKSILRNGLTLSAVSLLLRDSNEDLLLKDKPISINDICNKDENKNLLLCSNKKELEETAEKNTGTFASIKRSILPSQTDIINTDIKNFQATYKEVANKGELKKDINNILTKIPNSISPEAVFEILEKKSPTIKALLSESFPREAIMNCFKDGENANKSCDSILNNPEMRPKLIKAVSIESDALVAGVKNAHTDMLNAAGSAGKSAMEEAFLQIDNKKDHQEANIQFALAREKINKIINDPEFKKIEKLKKYVAEKYIKKCQTKATIQTENIPLTVGCELNSTADTNLSLASIKGLSGDVSAIIAKASFAENLSNKKGELGYFSKAELKEFVNYCNFQKTQENFSDVCNDIRAEHNQIKDQKESREWDEFEKKYWVESDPGSEKGYRTTEKKSNWSLLGEGLAPVIPTLIPLWLSNYQMQLNIESMTNQALFQKQYDHNINFYNNTAPWLYSYPFFQSPINLPSLNTNTNTNTSTTNGAGFNFQ